MTITEEHPSDELSGPSSLDVIAANFDLMTSVPREHLSLVSIHAKRLGRWVCITVCFKWRPENEVTVRMSTRWAQVLRAQLNSVLPKEPVL